jgi:glyoxylase-like metal-dependent hydrolase (beta-lactamase superfamily II)
MTPMCRFKFPIAWCALALGILPMPLLAQTVGAAADREIVQLTGDLYRVREGNRYTVFLVTPDGIVVGDPLSTTTAMWLKDELIARFPGRAVRFVLFTHHHFDRAEGAAVFEPAERIAHREFNNELSRAHRLLPEFVDAVDANRDGIFDAGELANTASGPLLLSKDRDGDDRVTPDELYRQVLYVRRTYDGATAISLGGRTIQLIHPGTAHAVDMTVLFFPNERMVFAADPPPVADVPFVFGPWQPSEIFDWIHTVARLDFDTLLFGDGRTLSRAQLTTLGAYLDTLREEVAVGYEQGLMLSQLRARPASSPSPHDSARDGQIAAIYSRLRLTHVVLTGSGGGAYGVRDATYCVSFAGCSTGGAVSTGVAALIVSRGRLGIGVELQMGAQSWHSRTSPSYDEEFALRDTRVAVLARYAKLQQGLSFSVVGGPSFSIADLKGMSREKAAVAPLGGRHPLSAHGSRAGVTGGVDLARSLGSRFSIIIPIRLTRLLANERDLWPGDTTLTVGAGLSVRLARRVQ